MAEPQAVEAPKPTRNLHEAGDRLARYVNDDMSVRNTSEEPKAEKAKTEIAPEAPAEDEAVEASEQENQPEKVETSEAQEADEGQSGEELPESIEDFAKALDMTPEDLAQHVKVKVKVDGVEKAVTLHEALNGYQRDADYRQKTAGLADQKRQFDAAVESATKVWQDRLTRLDAVIENLGAQLGERDDAYWLNYLEANGADAYAKERLRWDAQNGVLQRAVAERENAKQQALAEYQNQIRQTRREQQSKLAEKIADLAKPEGAQKFDSEVRAFLASDGFTAEEISNWMNSGWDHRHVLYIRDAMNYRALKSKTKEVKGELQSKPKAIKPGTSSSPQDRQAGQLRALRERLRKQPRDLKTAGKLFERYV